MDKTKKYILMSEKAIDIQKRWKPDNGHYVYRKYNIFGKKLDRQIWDKSKLSEIIILVYKSSILGYYHAIDSEGNTRIFHDTSELMKCTSIWLPTQDQLQEMLEGNCYDKAIRFKKWLEDDETILADSMEQLWLAFVMKEKYNKVWNGKDWVKK